MITNYLTEMIECLRPDTDEREYDAFSQNDSNEPDEFSPESIYGLDTDCNGKCFSDADPGL